MPKPVVPLRPPIGLVSPEALARALTITLQEVYDAADRERLRYTSWDPSEVRLIAIRLLVKAKDDEHRQLLHAAIREMTAAMKPV